MQGELWQIKWGISFLKLRKIQQTEISKIQEYKGRAIFDPAFLLRVKNLFAL